MMENLLREYTREALDQSRAVFCSLSNKMAAEIWWQKLLNNHLDDLSSETRKPIRFDDEFRNSFPSSCSLGRDAWDEIAACTTVSKKVHRLLRTIEVRGELAFKALVYALWKSGQLQAAATLDERGAWRPQTVVWFCCNEYQAHSVLQCLMRFKMAASNLIAKTIYSDDKESVYCQVQVAFTDSMRRWCGIHSMLCTLKMTV